jgi:hypothetical protein
LKGKGATYRTICRSLAVDPEDGSVYFTTGDGAIHRYWYERDAVETVAGDNLKKDYFDPRAERVELAGKSSTAKGEAKARKTCTWSLTTYLPRSTPITARSSMRTATSARCGSPAACRHRA